MDTLTDFENLLVAATDDEFEIVEDILKRDKNLVNTPDTNGRLPIFWDIETEMFDLLLKYGADVNQKDIHGRNLIQFMFDNNEVTGRIGTILTSIRRVNKEVLLSQNYRGMTLLHFIREMHNLQGCENDGTFSCQSCQEFTSTLIENGVSVNSKDVFGRTPLHIAASCSCLESIKILLNTGANIEWPRLWEHLCCASDDERFEECLDILYKHGCSVNQTEADGNALHIAVSNGSPKYKTVKWLMEHGIDVLCFDSMGNTAIHNCVRHLDNETETIGTDDDELVSIENDNVSCIRYLSDSGIDVNKQNKFGFTALHYAVDLKLVNMVSLLLKLGADINIRAFTGETPIHTVVKEHVYIDRFAKFFSDSDSWFDITAVDNYGSSPLHWAIMYRTFDVFMLPKVLESIEEVVDNKGRTPLDLAFAYNVCSIIDSSEFRLQGSADIHLIDHTYSKLQSPETMRDMDTENEEDKAVILRLEGGTCDPPDPYSLCPQLAEVLRHTIDDEYGMPMKKEIVLDDWMMHVSDHCTGVKELVDIVINANEQGLVQDLVENDHVKSAVRLVMDEFARRMSIEDPLFTCRPVLMGSYREGTKVYRPDEFDYVFRFIHFQESFNPEECIDFPGFLRLKLKTREKCSAFKPYVDEKGYLDAVKFVSKFYICCNSVLRDADFMKSTNLYPVDTLSMDAYSIDDIKLRWVGPTIKDLEISVDIVPAFGLNRWVPDSVDVSHDVLTGPKTGHDLIAVFKTQDEELVKGWSTFLRASVAPLEIAVMEALPLHVKKGYILVKALKAANQFPQIRTNDSVPGFISFLTTYMVKCSFLHEVEMNLHEVNQEKSTPASKKQAFKWAHRIIDRITRCINDKHLPGFFMKNTEFLRDAASRTIDEDKVSIGLAECACLKKLLDIAE